MGSKLFRLLGFGGLAIFMGVATVLGGMATLPVVMNAKAETQQGGLGLDPENDPVVFTTNGGLEIRKHEAVVSGSGQITGTATYKTNRNASATQDLRNFYYFTMGTWSGTIYTGASTTATFTVTNQPVNWIIIGRGNMDSFLVDETPAGVAIGADAKKNFREFVGDPVGLGVVENEEIPDDCVLVLSERLLGEYVFKGSGTLSVHTERSDCYGLLAGTSAYTCRYKSSSASSDLYTKMCSLLSINASTGAIESGKNGLGFTAEQAKLIVPQQLNTCWHNSSGWQLSTPSNDGGTYYTMFPLASNTNLTAYTQSFCIEDYLATSEQRMAAFIGSMQCHNYWTRTGADTREGGYYDNWARSIWYDGTFFPHTTSVSPSGIGGSHSRFRYGVRPAFVMEFVLDLIG